MQIIIITNVYGKAADILSQSLTILTLHHNIMVMVVGNKIVAAKRSEKRTFVHVPPKTMQFIEERK